MTMKDCMIARLLIILFIFASILLLSSCDKINLNLPQWLNPKKNEAFEAAGFDWPRWRGPEGNGKSREMDWNPKALGEGPTVLWRTNVGFGYSNVAIEDDRLYTMGRKREKNNINNFVLCLDTRNGKLIWKYSYENIYDPQSTPTIDGDYIYALNQTGNMLCLNKKNGRVRWSRNIVKEYQAKPPHYGISGSPIIAGDLIILTANTVGMALN